MTQSNVAAPATAVAVPLRALRVLATLSVVNLLWQFVTAGQLFGGGEGALGPHAAGAIVLHVLTGLTAIAAGVVWYRSRGAVWPTVLAVVVFLLTFVQAYFGDRSTLAIHIPGAIILTVGAVWLMAWAYLAGRPATR